MTVKVRLGTPFTRMAGFIVIFSLIATTTLQGQACCSGGVPISNNVGFRSVDSIQLLLRGFTDVNILNSFYNGTDKLDNNNVALNQKSSVFSSF